MAQIKRVKKDPLKDKKTLTPHEVAEYMDIAVGAVYRLLHAGRMPNIRIGKNFYIPRAALERWLESTEGAA